jgi:hypothetical protein
MANTINDPLILKLLPGNQIGYFTNKQNTANAGSYVDLALAKEMLKALQEIPTECDHKEPHLSACWVCLVKETIKKSTI